MQLSTPIYRLKRQARLLSRASAIPLHKALDRLAIEQGFQSWSHLASQHAKAAPAAIVLDRLAPGDMVLLGARPGHGKTLLGLELAAKAGSLGRSGFFFTLDYHDQDVADRLAELGLAPPDGEDGLVIDTSDAICADHVIARMEQHATPAIAVIDYLQLLDQRRALPGLAQQMATLRSYVKKSEAICVLISQIDRGFESSGRPMPALSDVRLPNPLDLSIFDKGVFLNDGTLQMARAA